VLKMSKKKRQKQQKNAGKTSERNDKRAKGFG
jgi:hypothetical protein